MKKCSLIVLTLALAACAAKKDLDDGQYWQRASASELAYTQGPKAQQMLNRDIARCVTELRELQRLGQIKDSVPPEDLDSPDREGFLLAEHENYEDFETCMHIKGWERVKHVPYDVEDRAKKNYLEVLADGVSGMFTDDKSENPGGYNDYSVNN